MTNPNLRPLGDFKPSDVWQTHVNNIFYGLQGPGIHNHFQTYVSLDHRLAHALAEEFFEQTLAQSDPAQHTLQVQEWGVGNGNLGACFLTRLKELDTESAVYPRIHYTFCDYSREILNGVRANPMLDQHAGQFSTVQVNAESMDCFRPRSLHKIISNEIWDDLATKVLLKHEGMLFEEFLQPWIDPTDIARDFEAFEQDFRDKDLEELESYPPFLQAIQWEHDFQRVDLDDWPYADAIEKQMAEIDNDTPTPVNIGAFKTLERAHTLLAENSLGYSGFDYGMHSLAELNSPGRPYFNLYGGQYTSMVNFDLLERVGKVIGFGSVGKTLQHDFVGQRQGDRMLSMLEVLQSHPQITQMAPWDQDLLMVQTLQAINGNYKSPYKRKLEFPIQHGTPKKQKKLIGKLVQSLNPGGVPDTVAYVTSKEVLSVIRQLKKLGYREKNLQTAFNGPNQPIAFTHITFK